jgi:uncharacterized protein YdcH (DUF465 family)
MYNNRLQHLEEAHRALNKRIDDMEKTGIYEDLQIEELKKQRLHLKDKLAILKKSQENFDNLNYQKNESKM